ncbi:hypothetical protein FQZ97_940200 [compost metagenome]
MQQLVFGERFGEVVLRAHHASAGFVKQAILGGQHDNRNVGELGVALDDGAGLIAVEAGHQDVAENQIWLVVVDLGEGIEAIVSQQDFVPTLLEEDFGASPNGVAVVDNQNFQGGCWAHDSQAPGMGQEVRHSGQGARASVCVCQCDGNLLIRFGPSRSPLCERRIRGKSSSSAPETTGFQPVRRAPAHLALRRKSSHKSGTSKSSFRSWL